MASTEEQQTTVTPSACCTTGFIHRGKPQGSTATLHGVSAYVSSGGDASKGVIVIIPDVFGWALPNVRLLADRYAALTGLATYVPDFMFGDSFPAEHLEVLEGTPEGSSLSKVTSKVGVMSKLVMWAFRHREAVTLKIVKPWFEALHAQEPKRKVFVAGFCWGGYYAVKLAHRDTWMLGDGSFREGGFVSAIYTAHPSLLTIPKDIDALAKPASFALAEKDERLGHAKQELIKAALAKKPGVKSEVVVFEGATHGFATRGNDANEVEKAAMEKAAHQATAWFKQFLA